MKSNKHGLEEYYQEKYAKKQFPKEYKAIGAPDLKISDGKRVFGKQILVIGCNTGADVAYLTRDNYVKGLDIMAEAVQVAKQNGVDAEQCNVEKGLSFPSMYFDIVVCKEVLEHLIDPEYVMNEINRILKADGYALISVPNHFWYYFRFRILLGKGLVMPWDAEGRWHDWDYFHIRFFTFESFKELIKATNFVPVKFYYPDTVSDIFAPGKLKKANKLFPRKLGKALVQFKPNLFSRDFIVKIKKA
jgi:2-polyprenyl-3-methyl-5-hydroxy-6-metoxy-1,4-benzoquinol methylase